jgi:hypothetical protein
MVWMGAAVSESTRLMFDPVTLTRMSCAPAGLPTPRPMLPIPATIASHFRRICM